MTKKIKISLILVLLLIVTGCTQHIRDENNRIIKYEKTGQNLTSNILCKPTTKELLAVYERYNNKLPIPLEDLPTCSEFRPRDLEYRSIWESAFVKPLAFLILRIGGFVRNYGLGVMIVGLLMRIAMLPLSLRTARQAEGMKKAKPEIEKIEKKYKGKSDSASMMAKSQETMMTYKKHKISPLSGCLMAFIQLPIFFAFLEAINRVPAIFEESLLTLSLGMTPWVGIFTHGKYLYIVLIALIICTTYYSFKNTMATNPGAMGDAGKQMQFMFKFMIIIISVASLSLPAAIGFYWVVTNGFAVVQNLIVKRSMK